MINYLSILAVAFLATVATALLDISCHAAEDPLMKQRKIALDLIADFADRICKDIPLKGGSSDIELTGKAKAELSNMTKKIADLGIEGGAKYQKSEFEGILQKDLITALGDSRKCKLDVLKELNNKLLTPPMKSPPQKRADLKVTPLVLGKTVKPLKGHPVLNVSGRQTLTGGMFLNLIFSHDHGSSHSIIVSEVKPVVRFMQPQGGPLPEYEVDASELPPQGFVKPASFLITVAGKSISEITWIDEQGLHAKPENLLATSPPRSIHINSGGDDVMPLEGIVSMTTSGYYEVSFRIVYSVAGQVREISTEKLSVLYNE